MKNDCQIKIEELHVFIESWLKGTIQKTKQVFQYFEDELDDDFIITHPSGARQTKADVALDFWNAYGVQSENFSIEIKNVTIRTELNDLCILNYEEWQAGNNTTARISSVVFRKTSENCYWFHLHETWLPVE